MVQHINAQQSFPDGARVAAEPFHKDHESPPRTNSEVWQEHVANARSILADIKAKLDWLDEFRPDEDAVLVVRRDGNPEGVLYLHNEDVPDLLDIATLPGTSGNGRILIEAAVWQSTQWGRGGKLQTIPMSETARAAFKAMGFVGETGILELDPNPETNTRWIQNGDRLTLKNSARG